MFALPFKAAKYGVVFVAGAIVGAKAARFIDGLVPDDGEFVGVADAPEIDESEFNRESEEDENGDSTDES